MPATTNVDPQARAVESMRAQAAEYEAFAIEVGGVLAGAYQEMAEDLAGRADRLAALDRGTARKDGV